MVREGQIVLIPFPQTDQSPGKVRPALVLRKLPSKHDDWLICMISSRLSQQLPDFDDLIAEADDDFGTSGLKVTSVIRISRLAIVQQGYLLGSIGHLSEARLEEIRNRLCRWICRAFGPDK